MKTEDFGAPLTPADIDRIVHNQDPNTPLQPSPDLRTPRSNLSCFVEAVALVLVAAGCLALGISIGASH